MQDIYVGALAGRASKTRKQGWMFLPTKNYIPEAIYYSASSS
jgi:hypothetical protein